MKGDRLDDYTLIYLDRFVHDLRAIKHEIDDVLPNGRASKLTQKLIDIYQRAYDTERNVINSEHN